MRGNSILIIDDDPDVLSALNVLLEDEFKKIVIENNPKRIPTLISEKYDVILLDMNFSAGVNTGNEGLFWLSKILEINKDAAVIMMTAYGNISLAVEAIKRGAKDFVLKPWDNEKLLATISGCLAMKRPSPEKEKAWDFNFVRGASRVMVELQEQIRKVADTDASILILGENGTGKEVVAKEIHKLSARASQVFVAVDMSSISPNLFESELFGHKKGSFTDARTDRTGRFESANGGSLFLDEIGNIPLPQQAKLLTVLQNQKVIPVGSNDAVPINVRLISATNAPLNKMVERGEFRQDLLYRINTITLKVPPLRERGEDIVSLANHFLSIHATKYKKEKLIFGADALTSLSRHDWPGNVRELQHTIEKAVILSNGDVINSKDLNLSISSKEDTGSRGRTLDEIEKEALVRALSDNAGNIVQAAKALGITRQTIYNKMKKYGI
jgi:two-component system, NtrC family, response regulator HydG